MSGRLSLEHWLGYSVRRHALDGELERIRGCMSGRVLEIGNGHGGRRGRFRPPVGETEAWIYLDLEPARRPDVQADVEHLPFEGAVFDTVVCLEVLEYVTDPPAALKEIRRVLKPQGTFILATPFLHRADTPHDYWRFTEHGARYLLDRAGFAVLELSAQGHALGVAVNTLKYAIDTQPPGWRRRLLGYLIRPVLTLLWRLDGPTARHQETLRTFSTGYLIVAHPLPGGALAPLAEGTAVCLPVSAAVERGGGR